MFSKFIHYGLSEGMAKLVPLLSSLILAKAFGPESFGILALIIVVNEITFIIISNNIAATTRVVFFDQSNRTLNEHVNKSLSYSLILFLIAQFVFSIFAYFTEHYILFLLPLIGVARTFTNVVLALFQCSRNSKNYLYVQLLYVFTFCIVLGFTIELGIISWVISMTTSVLVQAIIAKHFLAGNNYKTKLKLVKTDIITAKYGWSFMPQAFGWWAKSGVDRFSISSFLGAAILGNYVLAFQFASVLVLLSTALNLTYMPSIAKGVRDQNYKNNNRIYLITVTIITVIGFILYWFAKMFLDIYYSGDYAESLILLPFLIMSSAVHALVMVIMNELYQFKKERLVSKYVLLIFLTQGLVNFFIAKYATVYIVAISGVVFNIVLLFLVLYSIKITRMQNIGEEIC